MLVGRRWHIVGLLFLAGIINYLDRSAFGVAAPLIAKDLHLGPAALGVIFSAFFVGYALFNFVGGFASDKISAFWVFGCAFLAWSIFCASTAMAVGFGSLLVIRILFGISEGPFGPTASKLVNNWFPRGETARAMGFVNGGTPLGGAIAGPIAGFCVVAFGWRYAFIAVGIMSVLFSLLWFLFASNAPDRDGRITDAERREILTQRAMMRPRWHGTAGLWDQLKRPEVLSTTFAFFGYNYILYFFLSWFPTYLIRVQHLSMGVMSLMTVIPWSVGCIGLIAGGFLSDWLSRTLGNPLLARKSIIVIALGGSAIAIAMAGYATSLGPATALVSAAVFLLYLTSASYWSVIHDVVPEQYVGGASGFLLAGANISGVVGPSLTGFIVASTGLFTTAFLLAGVLTILGAFGVFLFVRSRHIPLSVG